MQPQRHLTTQRPRQRPGRRVAAAFSLATLLFFNGCASVTTKPLQERGHYRAACALLVESRYEPEDVREQLNLEKNELTRRVARDSAVRLSFHALDADEITRLVGVAPLPTARYGEDYLLVRVTLDASRSRVPVELQYVRLSAVGDAAAWTTEHYDTKEVKVAHMALFGADSPTEGAADRGGVGFGPSVAFDFKTFEPLGPFAIHGWALFHLMTGGLVLLSNAMQPRSTGGGFYFSPVLRERDEDVSRLTWSPDTLRPAPPSPSRAVSALRELEGVSSGCRAEPGERCQTYKLALKLDPEDRSKDRGKVSGNVIYHLEPACPLSFYNETPLPPGSTLREQLRALEGAGPAAVQAPTDKKVSR